MALVSGEAGAAAFFFDSGAGIAEDAEEEAGADAGASPSRLMRSAWPATLMPAICSITSAERLSGISSTL